VLVDSSTIGEIPNGGTVRGTVFPGIHSIQVLRICVSHLLSQCVHSFNPSSNILQFQVRPGETKQFHLSVGTGQISCEPPTRHVGFTMSGVTLQETGSFMAPTPPAPVAGHGEQHGVGVLQIELLSGKPAQPMVASQQPRVATVQVGCRSVSRSARSVRCSGQRHPCRPPKILRPLRTMVPWGNETDINYRTTCIEALIRVRNGRNSSSLLIPCSPVRRHLKGILHSIIILRLPLPQEGITRHTCV
jgi:hypothetical protein